MKPNFALSLSFDGLRLMHRVADGWHLVGQVALDDPDVDGALERLRAAALTLEPSGVSTKLLIPNDQIRYIAIDGTRAEEDDVRAALDGTTPYAVQDLSYDFAKGGGRTYVAAVAKETLDEAEAFAKEHGFNPISFAAVPEPFTFVGEAVFGSVAGFEAERDAEPVIVTGTVDVGLPDLSPQAGEPSSEAKPAADAPETSSGPESGAPDGGPDAGADQAPVFGPSDGATAAPDAEGDDDKPDEADSPDVPPITPSGEIADPEFEPAPDALTESLPDPLYAAEPAAEPDPKPVSSAEETRPEADETAPSPALPYVPTFAPAMPDRDDIERDEATAKSDVSDGSAPVFASRLRADRNDGRSGPVATPAPRAIPSKDKATRQKDKPAFSSRRTEPTVGRAAPPPLAVPTGKGTDAMPPVPSPDSVPAPDVAPAPAVKDASPVAAAPAVTGAPAAAGAVDAAVVAATLSPDRASDSSDPHSATPAPNAVGGAVGGMFASRRMAKGDTATTPSTDNTPDDATRLTVFGARKAPKSKAVVGGKPRFLGLILTAILLLFLLAIAAFAALSEDGLARWFGFAPSGTQIADAPLPSAGEVTPRPAETTEQVAAVSLEPTVEPSATAEAAEPDLSLTPTTDALATPTAPAGGHVLSPEEATRIYAATGVWQRAPRIPFTPRTTSIASLKLGGNWQSAPRTTASPLADASSVAGDALIATPIDPPAPDRTFNFGDDGLVVATPEGSATPDGIVVIAGTPVLNPPTRPGTVAPEITPQDQIAEVVPDDAERIENAPDGVVVINARPVIAPPVRTGTVSPAPAPEAALIADGDAPILANDGLLVLTGSPPVLPPVRPGTQAPAESPATEPATVDPQTESPPSIPQEEASASPEPAPPDAIAPAEASAQDVVIVSGSPPILPPARAGTVAPQNGAAVDVSAASVVAAPASGTAQTPDATTPRPRDRPAAIVQAAETRANAPVLGALSTSEAVAFRPRTRPSGLAPEAQAEPEPEPAPEPQVAAAPAQPTGLQLAPEIAAAVQAAANRPNPFVNPTTLAVTRSERPDTRPRNMERIVARAAANQQRAAAQAAAVPRAAAVTPTAPTTGSVAQAATLQNEINLRDINLIGIFGGSSDRRALVRLSNGRYVRVTVGDRLDGGRVTGISANALSYNKRGRTVTLEVAG